ncbi:MAG: pyocin knob domain-containing protein [Amaricoccus sp.]|uniref:pyocin knob domain-containing protein n=1 Tax=Amaricoccus sp. TaxID=1872485 RepID=UPI0039E4AFA1
MAGKKISEIVANSSDEVDYSREAYMHAAQDSRDVWARLSQVFGLGYDPAARKIFGAGGWSITLPFARSAKPELSEVGLPGLISAVDQAKLDGRPEPMAVDQDANALTTRGASYRRDGDSGAPTNVPSSVYGILRVFGRAADRLVQYYDEVGTSGPGRLWRRTLNTDDFSAWRWFLTNSDGAAIRDALGALTGENRLDAAAIKNLQSVIVSLLVGMDATGRGNFFASMSAGLVGPGEAWATKQDGTGIEGLGLSLDDVASQQDILAGIDIDKVLTAAAVGGFYVQRSIPYAATITMSFAGATPAWGAENLVPDVSGAVVLQAAEFPSYMEGKEFTVRFRRASGAGNLTIQSLSGGAAVEYRGGLSALDIPPLGTTAGDSIAVRGKVISTTSWRVLAFEWKP